MARLLALLFAVLASSAQAEEAALTAATQLASEPANPATADGFALDGNHLLKPEGLGWLLLDTRSGEEKHLILPAFHPDHSRPAMAGDKLAYVSYTKKGEQSQLGCITFDLAKGKVLNRRDTDLTTTPDSDAVSIARIGEDGQQGTCALRGQRCGHGGNCAKANEDVSLSFVPLEEARRGLKGKKGSKGSARSSKSGSKHGKGKAAHSSHGAKSGKKVSPSTKRHATRKVRHS